MLPFSFPVPERSQVALEGGALGFGLLSEISSDEDIEEATIKEGARMETEQHK